MIIAMSTPVVESVLDEQRRFAPSAEFAAAARVRAADLEALRTQAAADPEAFWAGLARAELGWRKLFTRTLDATQAPNFRWFVDGELNVSWNCLDVHLAERGHKTAILFEGEPGDQRRLTYRELHGEVCRFANAMKARGIGRGDRVVKIGRAHV